MIKVWHILLVAALLCGANWYSDGAITDSLGGAWGLMSPHETTKVVYVGGDKNNTSAQTVFLVKQDDGTTAKWLTAPSPNVYHQVDGIWVKIQTADSGNPYANWPTAGTLVFDQSYYQGLINTLKQDYPGYTLKVYDNGRMRVFQESWVRDIFTRSQNLADNSKSTNEDLADQTYQGRFSENLGLFLQKKDGNGWDIVVPVISSNDESITKVFEIPARSTYLDNPKDLPTTPVANPGPSNQGGANEGKTSYQSAQGWNNLNPGSSGSLNTPPSTSNSGWTGLH